MIRLLLLVSALCKVHGQFVPLIYAAPSAVSHQSRIDIKHSPGFIAGPLIYSPGTNVYATHQLNNNEKSREAVITPVFTADTIFTPVALSFFHNLPLARALEHPISIDKMQEENSPYVENVESANDEEVSNMVVTEALEQENQNEKGKSENQDKNYIIIAYDDNNQIMSTTDEPKMDVVTED